MAEAPTTLDAPLVAAFFEASRDGNPVHEASEFTRRQLGGRAVAYGGLSVLCALTVALSRIAAIGAFRAQFLHPVSVGETLNCRVAESDDDGSVTVHGAVEGRRCLTLKASPKGRGVPGRGTGEEHSLPSGRKNARLHAAFPQVPQDLLAAVCALSWFAGSCEPGAGSVLGTMELERAMGAPTEEAFRIERRAARLGGALQERSGELSVHGSLFGFRFASMPARAVPALDYDAIELALAPAMAPLKGRRVLVLGGTRGLGGSVSVALASAGADVDAVYRTADTEAAALARVKLDGSISPVKLDLDRPGSLAEASRHLLPGAAHGYDGVVYGISTGIQPGRSPRAGNTAEQLGSAVATSWWLLEEAAAMTGPGGWLCYVSSAAVERCPPLWQAYGIEKAAGEWIATTVCREAGLTPLILRPPLLDTEFSAKVDPFAPRLRPETVALSLVRAIFAHDSDAGPVVVPIDHHVGRPK